MTKTIRSVNTNFCKFSLSSLHCEFVPCKHTVYQYGGEHETAVILFFNLIPYVAFL